ncbi:hypothetical protein HGI10_66890 [Streptomyces collinus]|nr:hypothetical protein HGI10_66890 [Streptomyces collinus]
MAGKADAPFNCVSLVTVKDAFGNPLIVGPGYEMLYLLPKYSGQFGIGPMRDITSFPVVQRDRGGHRNFQFSTYLRSNSSRHTA